MAARTADAGTLTAWYLIALSTEPVKGRCILIAGWVAGRSVLENTSGGKLVKGKLTDVPSGCRSVSV